MTKFNPFFFVLFILFFIGDLPAWAQKNSGEITLKEAFSDFEKKSSVKFFYKNDWVKEITVDQGVVTHSLSDFLAIDLKTVGLGNLMLFDSKYIVLFKGSPPGSSLKSESGENAGQTAPAIRGNGDLYVLSGVVRDANTNETIIGATVYAEEAAKGTVTNHEGYFTIKLPEGTHRIHVTAVGKLPTIQAIRVTEDQRMDLEMFEQTTQLDDIVVLSQGADRNVSSTEMSSIKMDIKTMRVIPQFMGEVDVIRSILMLPGVSTVGEGASGFNVRGGNVDQNLILLDETPLYNSSHLFGFFSTFNPDFVKDVTLLKGGMPANYGGRIASVLDVKMKDGNPNKLSGTGGVGIISSRFLLEGPIGSDKTSFIIGGRYAYPDWIIHQVPDLNVQKSSSNFYDLNFRLRHQFNDKNSLHVSAYRSADKFKFAADTTYGWSTTNFSVRWNTAINEKLFANVTGIYSDYRNEISGTYTGKEFNSGFGILTRGGKVDFTYIPNIKHKIDFGANLTFYTFNPGKLTTPAGSSVNPVTIADEYSIETGYYVSDEFKVNQALSIHAGLRYSQYNVQGPADIPVYDPSVPKSPSTIIGALHFSSGQNIKTYSGWEPRLALKYSLNDWSSVKVSYNRNLQYLQLISNTTAVSPFDLWKTSNYYIPPQTGNQVAIGYFRNFKQNKYEFSVEAYYKQVDNLVEYKDGANLYMNPYLESQLLAAKGLAYGIEFLLRKREGKLTGWVAYTYARSFRQVQGNTPQETVNSGKLYPSNFDKPNDVAVVANYSFTRRLSMSANFTYSTGRPITYPQSVYLYDGYAVAQYTDRNQVRIPDYHRLDLSFTIEESLKRTKKWKGSWTFSIYNVYGRANPYSVFFKPQSGGYQTQSYRLAVIGTAFPSITYNFKF